MGVRWDDIQVIRTVQPQDARSNTDSRIERRAGSMAGVSDHQRATSFVSSLEDLNVIVMDISPSFAGSAVDSTYDPFLELKGET